MQPDLGWMVGKTTARIHFSEPCSWFFDLEGGGGVRTESLWRVIGARGVEVCSQDHGHQFGLPAPVDAAERACQALSGGRISTASVREPSGDFVLEFSHGPRLEILTTSSGYENWETYGPVAHVVGLGGGRASLVLPLAEIADALDMVTMDCAAYVNLRTGDVFLETELGLDRPDLESGDYLPLPDYQEIADHRILESFCEEVEDPGSRAELLEAIRGRGAFGRFNVLAGHLGLLDGWFAYRRRKLARIAAEWCADNGIGYTVRGDEPQGFD